MAVEYPREDVLLLAVGKMNSELRREVWANNTDVGGLNINQFMTQFMTQLYSFYLACLLFPDLLVQLI